ncbi:hypothetical protein QQZ08_000435 [Neonectria magnoliae]|uniref:DUF3669 domain-containing protein n=1 Tax=Neonectria magnoliae TaxID=2732573 RepID=A0ABR1IJ95_9HYPO
MRNQGNRDCLAWIYLGRRLKANAPLQRNFSLRNFNFHLDQILGLGLPVEDYARVIAEALAVVHWDANVDAYDVEYVCTVEYVLGSEAETIPTQARAADTDFMKSPIRIWVLDFNLCSRWEEAICWEQPEALVDQLVIAFFENDPYYPLPLVDEDKQLLNAFREQYFSAAEKILTRRDERLRGLPAQF